MIENKKIHMIGIGGISMSGIAEILLSFNCKITGYDKTQSELTESLKEKGIKVNYDINLKNVEDADIIVYTAAMPEDFEELVFARSLNKEIYERGKFLGLLMKKYENVLCISGTHGKSTTTGMVSTIFMKNNLNPTIQIGAMLPIIDGNYHVGDKKYFIAEACEYHDSFLDFFPTSIVILNIDDDHLDYFGTVENAMKSFTKYMDLAKDIIINNDDENTVKASYGKNCITYGVNNDAKYMAKNIKTNDNGSIKYDLYINNNYVREVELEIRGLHNVYNSLSAIAISNLYINNIDDIVEALKDYTGVGRRFEKLGTYKNALVYDDYAHHPSEINATLNSVNSIKHNVCHAIFMSHTYSRTAQHFDEFAKVLSKFDDVVITPIYAARETNTFNVKEEDLVSLINSLGGHAIFIKDDDKIIDYIKSVSQDDDIIISIGAGPVNRITEKIAQKND